MATKRVKNPESLDAIDIALARAVDSDEARALLAKQARLIDSQETLARADLRHRGWQIIGERVAAILKGMTVLVGLLVLLGIVGFFWTASRAGGMVMDPFAVPATMERQGLTGSVVAQQLLDKVSALETMTKSARASSSYENSWSDSKGVVVPYAGVSLGELRREARDWLGSEKHLSGEVVQLGGGRIAVSFRSPLGAGRVEGREDDLDKLLGEAAVQLFKITQPYRYAIWRSRHGASTAELRAEFTALTRSSNLQEVAWGYHGLSNAVATSNAERRAYYAKAFAAVPNFLPAYSNLPFYFANEGKEEATVQSFSESAKRLKAGSNDYNPSHGMHYGLAAEATVAAYRGDMVGAAKLYTDSAGYQADDANTAIGPFLAASAWADAHDLPQSIAQLAGAGYLDPGKRAEAEALIGMQPTVNQLRARATDDLATQLVEVAKLWNKAKGDAASSADLVARQNFLDTAASYQPDLAYLLAKLGRIEEARRMIAERPTTDDEIARLRAFIETLARQPNGDRLFAQAAARTPTLPGAQAMWAEAKLIVGDAQSAADHAALAAELGPKNADNHRIWGKALLALRRPAEAADKFALAAKNAPAWGRARLDWAEALWQSGRRDDAVVQLKEASLRTLSDADRAKLRRMVASAKRQLGARN